MKLDSSIAIMSINDYLSFYLPTNDDLLTLYESLSAVVPSDNSKGSKIYEEYLPDDVLQQGIVSVSSTLL